MSKLLPLIPLLAACAAAPQKPKRTRKPPDANANNKAAALSWNGEGGCFGASADGSVLYLIAHHSNGDNLSVGESFALIKVEFAASKVTQVKDLIRESDCQSQCDDSELQHDKDVEERVALAKKKVKAELAKLSQKLALVGCVAAQKKEGASDAQQTYAFAQLAKQYRVTVPNTEDANKTPKPLLIESKHGANWQSAHVETFNKQTTYVSIGIGGLFATKHGAVALIDIEEGGPSATHQIVRVLKQ